MFVLQGSSRLLPGCSKFLNFIPLTLITLSLLSVAGCTPDTATSSASPETRADTTLQIAAKTVFSFPDTTVIAARKLMSETADSGLYYRSSTLLALGSLMLGRADSCNYYFDRALGYTVRHPDDYLTLEQVERDRSLYFNLLGQLDSAIYHTGIALQAARNGRLWDKAVKNLAIAGEAQEQMGRPIEAAAIYRQAIHIGDSLFPEKMPDSQVLVGLAATYTSMGNYNDADEYLALNASRIERLTPEQQYFHYSTQGNSLYLRQDYARAVEAFREAYARASDDPYLLGVAEGNIGECMLFMNQLDSADHYINMSRDHISALGADDIQLSFYMNSLRGDLALRKGDIAKAGKLLDSATADTANVMPRYQAMHYGRLTRYYENTGDHAKALMYLRRSHSILDSIRTCQALNYPADLEHRYHQDTTVLKSVMRVQHKEEEVQRLRVMSVAITLALIIIILGVVLWNLIQRRRAGNEAMALRTAMQALRMENVSNRVSSHFIFNVLNGLTAVQSRRLTRVTDLIRKNINLSNKAIVTLKEELDFIDNYIDVERESLMGEFVYNLRVDDEVNLAREIPAMMIQVFVENAIKHGLRGYEAPKFLDILISHPSSHLLIEIINNGNLRSSAPGTGTGLRVVTQTIHMLNARNRDKITLDYGIQDTCYRVVITIPDEYSFDYIRRLSIHDAK